MGKIDLMIIGTVVISFLINCIAFPFVPAKIVTHWNHKGEPDTHMKKTFGLFMLTALFVAIPKLEPAKKQMRKFLPFYNLISVWFMSMLLFVNIHVVLWNTSILKLNPLTVINASLAFLVLGLSCLFLRPKIKT